jgi:hypothetical protein
MLKTKSVWSAINRKTDGLQTACSGTHLSDHG